MSVVESGIDFSAVQTFSPQEVSKPLDKVVDIGPSSELITHDSMSHYSMSHYSRIEPLDNGVFKYHRRENLPPLDEDSYPELSLYVAFYGILATTEMVRQSIGQGSDKIAQSAGRMLITIMNTLW